MSVLYVVYFTDKRAAVRLTYPVYNKLVGFIYWNINLYMSGICVVS